MEKMFMSYNEIADAIEAAEQTEFPVIYFPAGYSCRKQSGWFFLSETGVETYNYIITDSFGGVDNYGRFGPYGGLNSLTGGFERETVSRAVEGCCFGDLDFEKVEIVETWEI